ncbi:MAG: DUF4124 domain-containing protein [Burkholderiales bacterium]
MMKYMASSIAVALAASLFVPVASAVEMYQWVDETGLTHISDIVPQKYKAQATRIDSTQFNVAPNDVLDAQRRAAALKTQADEAKARQTEELKHAQARAPTAAATSSAPTKIDQSCPALWRDYLKSNACFQGYASANGSLRPGAYQACGPSLVSPANKCGFLPTPE